MNELKLTKELIAQISPEDFEWASQWKWTATNCAREPWVKYYAIRRGSGKKRPAIYLHREVVSRILSGERIGEGLVVDHIDGNGLNNRRENLRLLTRSENARLKSLRYVQEPWL